MYDTYFPLHKRGNKKKTSSHLHFKPSVRKEFHYVKSLSSCLVAALKDGCQLKNESDY